MQIKGCGVSRREGVFGKDNEGGLGIPDGCPVDLVSMRTVGKKTATQRRRGSLVHFLNGNEKPLSPVALANLINRQRSCFHATAHVSMKPRSVTIFTSGVVACQCDEKHA